MHENPPRRLPVFGQSRVAPEEHAREAEVFARRMERREKFLAFVAARDLALVVRPVDPYTGHVHEPCIVPVGGPLVMQYDDGEGGIRTSSPIWSAGLFSDTTKMKAPSFSLPAGLPSAGGTCPASKLDGEPDKVFICHDCYATKGGYQWPRNVALSLIRRDWTISAVRDSSFAPGMIASIETILERPHDPRWDSRYFRVHDSGDFMGSAAYVRAWNTVAAHFVKRIIFWAPTRDWVFFPDQAQTARKYGNVRPNPDLAAAMRERPANFVIRPSALQVGDAPPVVHGLDGGTSVDTPSIHAAFTTCGPAAKGHQCSCPAYERSVNCQSAGCRTCWIFPKRQVGYKQH